MTIETLAGPAPANTPATIEPNGAPVIQNGTGITLAPTLSPERAKSFAAAMLARGVDPAIVAAAMEANGTPLPEDTRSAEEIAHDREYGFNNPDGVYGATDYHPQHHLALLAEGETAVAEAHAAGTEFLEALQITPVVGNFLIERAEELSQKFATASKAEIDTWKAEQKAQLVRKFNGDTAKVNEQIALAASAIRLALAGSDRAANYADRLVKSIAASDAYVIQTLAQQAEYIDRWAASRPKAPR